MLAKYHHIHIQVLMYTTFTIYHLSLWMCSYPLWWYFIYNIQYVLILNLYVMMLFH